MKRTGDRKTAPAFQPSALSTPMENLLSKTALPPWTLRKVTMPKWNGPQSILTCPQAIRKICPGIPPMDCLRERDYALHLSELSGQEENRLRLLARTAYGDAGSPVPCPVSGGVCGHWPREVIEEITEFLHRRQNWIGVAYAWHLYAGKRHGTFNWHPVPLTPLESALVSACS